MVGEILSTRLLVLFAPSGSASSSSTPASGQARRPRVRHRHRPASTAPPTSPSAPSARSSRRVRRSGGRHRPGRPARRRCTEGGQRFSSARHLPRSVRGSSSSSVNSPNCAAFIQQVARIRSMPPCGLSSSLRDSYLSTSTSSGRIPSSSTTTRISNSGHW
jgi:hypothetical protein